MRGEGRGKIGDAHVGLRQSKSCALMPDKSGVLKGYFFTNSASEAV
jgi:hypothetical protein